MCIPYRGAYAAIRRGPAPLARDLFPWYDGRMFWRLEIRSRRAVLLLWLAFWAAMFVATHVPIGDRLARLPPNGDKVLHFLMFFGLTMLGGRALQLSAAGMTGVRLVGWAAAYAAYAAVDEITQALPFVRRTADIRDWAWDVAGVVLATSLLWAMPRPGASDAADDAEAPH